MATEIQYMTREQACLLAEALYQWANAEIHKDAYEDKFVEQLMFNLSGIAQGGLQTALEVSDDYAEEHAKEMTRHFYNGNRQRYEAA